MAFDASRAEQLVLDLTADQQRDGRIGKVQRYLKGDHDLPYIPKKATREFKILAERSVTNWLPLFSSTFVKGLFVDGYRARRVADNTEAWDYWQLNGLDARQSVAIRAALEYGAGYVLVLPGGPNTPIIRPLSATRTMAWYEDDDDEWPVYGLYERGKTLDNRTIYTLIDNTEVQSFTLDEGKARRYGPPLRHGLGVTPLVRFRDRLDGEATGIIRPLITLQDRANEIVFYTVVALQFAAFRQRWATGLSVPEDDQGNPVEPFKAAMDRLWISDSPDTKFGDFSQTDIQGHERMYLTTIRSMAAIGEISPNMLTGDLVNLSAEALSQLRESTDAGIGQYKTIFGEPWESVFRLASKAAGNLDGAKDTSAQVRWRDTTPRSLEQVVEALGKMSSELGVPATALWERIPGVTDQDVETWKGATAADDGLQQLAHALMSQAAPALGAVSDGADD